MERYVLLWEQLVKLVSASKQTVLGLLKSIPLVGTLPDNRLEWIFVAMLFVAMIAIIKPLVKWSLAVAVLASILAGFVALVSSFSFWSVLPFTGLGVIIVLFSNRFQMS